MRVLPRKPSVCGRFSTIQLRLINKLIMDFESYFMSVSNVNCLFTSYILLFLRHVLGGMKNLKCYLFLLSILYMELYYAKAKAKRNKHHRQLKSNGYFQV
jgi:hypothetical protein